MSKLFLGIYFSKPSNTLKYIFRKIRLEAKLIELKSQELSKNQDNYQDLKKKFEFKATYRKPLSNKEAEDIDNEKKSDDSKTKSRKDSTESQKDSDADMDVENNPIASAATAAAAGTFKYITFKLLKIF